MRSKRLKKVKQLPFNYKLILNQWIVSQFGFDPLKDHKDGNQSFRPALQLLGIVKNAQTGMNSENLHWYYVELSDKLHVDALLTQEDLRRYEYNIASHTSQINERRDLPIVWKYYQWLSLLFTEIYLERFFADSEMLLEQINDYVDGFNNYWADQGYDTGLSLYNLEDLNKLCIQNATGSGKTLLMHVNFRQFRHYIETASSTYDITRAILITPNEALSNQHKNEMRASDIATARLLNDRSDLLTFGNCLQQVDFTEVTKLGDHDGPTTMAVRNLGDQNLLLVDEAHRGMGSREERGWFMSRSRLSRRGFVFEYSATFKEAVTAAKRTENESNYAKAILFDYSYRHFYEDGYGKDYRIFNLPKAYEALQFSYFIACLLSFYQQLKLYDDQKSSYAEYNLEKPLWVFVGSSVTKASGTKAERDTVSDVGQIIQFLADILDDQPTVSSEIERLLTSNAQHTGLLDENGGDIFAGSFIYLQHLIVAKKWTINNLLHDLLQKVFQTNSGGRLSIARIKGDENEITLKASQAELPFALINVGDAKGLTSHISDKEFDNVSVVESQFSTTLFKQITSSSSPINVLIGSKRFVEGWDCWRVSTLGLMRVGRSEGAQVIQLFGRGVRLKGYKWSLKRSSFSTPTCQPEYIQYVETLNVFGIEADFMERFRKFLEDEQLPTNDKKSVFRVPLTVTYDFGKRLKVLRPRRKGGDGREYDFKRDGAVPHFGIVPDKLRDKIIEIDWYPRIQSLESKERWQLGGKERFVFTKEQLAILDYDDLFFRLEKFKRERAWYNLNIEISSIQCLLADATWYELLAPSGKMNFEVFTNVRYWQQMACALLQKYMEEYYGHCKAAFLDPRLELREVEASDGSFPMVDEYQLIVDANEVALVNDIEFLIKDIRSRKVGSLTRGNLKGCLFDHHLYEPILHVAKESKIQISPVFLNESEFQFLDDLRKYIEHEKNRLNSERIEMFLLRNESRGRGIGFFEVGNFYPDFLFWQVKDGKQYLSFIEPHGLQHEGPGHKKIEFYQVIKNIEKRLGDKNVILNSFIVTPTRFGKLNWGKTISELEEMHVLFMNDQPDTYIKKISERMLG